MTNRGWCPTLFAPMPSGDGLLLRLKPRMGVLTSQVAHALAEATMRLGNGMINLTNRGNLQLRGFEPDSAMEFAEIAVQLGLANPDPQAEARRSVLVSPLIGLDPLLDPATFDIARMLDDKLARRTEFTPLPGKFGIVVCGGGVLPVCECPGDIVVQPQGQSVAISVDGCEMSANVPLADIREAMQELLVAFLADGPHRRMRDANAATIFARAGLVADMPRRHHTPHSPIGALPGAFGVGVPQGILHANDLSAVAALAEQNGDGTMRLTPWRALVLPGVVCIPVGTGLIADPSDPVLRVEACAGAPSCASASVNTIAAARQMATQVRWNGVMHISGCAKGCAHQGPAAFTLVGENGAWNLIRDGRPNSPPELCGVTLGAIAERVGQGA